MFQNLEFRLKERLYRELCAYSIIKKPEFIEKPNYRSKTFFGDCIVSGQKGNDIIYDMLMEEKPCMIARVGTVEMGLVQAYLDKKHGLIKKIGTRRGEVLCNNAGFFPNKEEALYKFGEIYADAAKKVDVLGVFGTHSEDCFITQEMKNAKLMQISALGPYYFDKPWSKALEGKKVLVIHPFETSIRSQYLNKRKELFDDERVLPLFELSTLKAVQTIAGNTAGFEDWFEALQYMKDQICKMDFDIAIIGCGAYGFPLAAHVKSFGKKSVLMAGATQLLFGIKGARWDNAPITSKYYKESWVRPNDSEKPQNANKVEQGCYW